MVRENIVTPANFIYPLFIHDEDFNTEIPSMPGCERHSLDSMVSEVGEAYDLGVKTFVLFPKVPDVLKTNLGVEAYNPEGIVHRAIRMIKEKYPDSVVCTDVALDPYSDQGTMASSRTERSSTTLPSTSSASRPSPRPAPAPTL